MGHDANWRLLGAVLAGVLAVLAVTLSLDATGAGPRTVVPVQLLVGVAVAAAIVWRF